MNLLQLEKIQQQTAALMQLQEAPDSTEAIASLPLLNREDLESKIKTIHSQKQSHHRPLFSNTLSSPMGLFT